MKLTASMLKNLVNEEAERMKGEEKSVKKAEKDYELDATEVDADEFADQLSKKFDYAKALGLEESRLRDRLKLVSERRKRIMSLLSK